MSYEGLRDLFFSTLANKENKWEKKLRKDGDISYHCNTDGAEISVCDEQRMSRKFFRAVFVFSSNDIEILPLSPEEKEKFLSMVSAEQRD